MSKNCETNVLACGDAGVALCRKNAETGGLDVLIAAEGADVRVLAHGGLPQAFEHLVAGARPSLVVMVPDGKPLKVRAVLGERAEMMTLAKMASLDVDMCGESGLEAGLADRAVVRADGGRVSLVSSRCGEIRTTGATRVSVHGAFSALAVSGGEETVVYSCARVSGADGLVLRGDVQLAHGSHVLAKVTQEPLAAVEPVAVDSSSLSSVPVVDERKVVSLRPLQPARISSDEADSRNPGAGRCAVLRPAMA